jgi:hypothetical protein
MYEKPSAVLFTGAGTGIGPATAELLTWRGRRVFGTSRDPSRVSAPEDIEMVALDVTVGESVAAGGCAVMEHAGRVDVLRGVDRPAGHQLRRRRAHDRRRAAAPAPAVHRKDRQREPARRDRDWPPDSRCPAVPTRSYATSSVCHTSTQ